MIDDLDYFFNDFYEFSSYIETVNLEPDHYEQALSLSENFGHESQQWQVYIRALALFGLIEWLNKREPSLEVALEQSSIMQHPYASAIAAVCNLKVGEFKICLLTTVLFSDEEITIPKVVVDIPEFNAHFYVVVAIEEELGTAGIKGFIRYDQLVNNLPALQPQKDWTYQLPLAWFNTEADELLLYLQCLSPTAIPLPEIPSNRQMDLAQTQGELLNLLPQIHDRPLWQVLTWSQGVVVFTNPELLNWLHNLSISQEEENTSTLSLTSHLSDLLQILSQQAVNIQHWLDNQIDYVTQTLSWNILPAIRTISSNPAQELEAILREISHNYNTEFPENVGRAYQDISLDISLRLYAITWLLPDNEWTLLLILKAIDNQPPYGFSLRVSDQTGILAEEELSQHTDHDYIFTQLIGTYKDKFLATITSANGTSQTLPPFTSARK